MGRGNKKSGNSHDNHNPRKNWWKKQSTLTQTIIVLSCVVIISVILGLFLVSISLNQISEGKTIGNSNLTNTTNQSLLNVSYHNFTGRNILFEYPSSWNMEPNTIKSHVADFKVNGTSLGRVEIWIPNENTTFEYAKDFTIDSVSMFDFNHIISQKTTKISGFPAYEIIYTFPSSGSTAKQIKIITVVEGIEYEFDYWDFVYNFDNGKVEYYRLINTTKFY